MLFGVAIDQGLDKCLNPARSGCSNRGQAYLEEEAHLDMRVNKRLLAGEVSQARSFNRQTDRADRGKVADWANQ